MKRNVKALTFEESVNLLPEDFSPCQILLGRKKLIKTKKGLVAFRHSSLLSCGEWETSYNEDDIRTTIDYLLYAVGYDGVLVLSREVLLSFEKENYNGRWANKGYPIHVYKENGRYIWRGMNGNMKDLTDYFIPSDLV